MVPEIGRTVGNPPPQPVPLRGGPHDTVLCIGHVGVQARWERCQSADRSVGTLRQQHLRPHKCCATASRLHIEERADKSNKHARLSGSQDLQRVRPRCPIGGMTLPFGGSGPKASLSSCGPRRHVLVSRTLSAKVTCAFPVHLLATRRVCDLSPRWEAAGSRFIQPSLVLQDLVHSRLAGSTGECVERELKH